MMNIPTASAPVDNSAYEYQKKDDELARKIAMIYTGKNKKVKPGYKKKRQKQIETTVSDVDKQLENSSKIRGEKQGEGGEKKSE